MGSTEDRKLALERLRVRAEMRSAGDDEDSNVIEREALSRAPISSVPARAKGIVAILNTLPAWSRPLIVLAAIAAATLAVLGGSKLAGWF